MKHRSDLWSRRAFNRWAVAAPLVLSPSVIARGAGLVRAGPNSRIGVGLIGCGKRLFEMLGPIMAHPSLQVVAVCDVDTTRREHAAALVNKASGNTDCRSFVRDTDLLAMPGVDAVVIATPDHWHLNQVLSAALARKDIYCEKPLTLTLLEGKMMIEACRRAGVVFQTGSQQRTEYGHRFVEACDYVRGGRIGRLLTVHVGVPGPSVPCDLPEEPLEPGLDWDRWLGPAPLRPYNSTLSPRGIHTHYPKWREYREYSGGGMTDFGAHNFDIAQWGMNTDHTGPVRVVPPKNEQAMTGAKLVYADGVEVIHGGPFGTTFTGTSGIISVFRDYIASIPEKILKEPLGNADKSLPRAKNHLEDWVACMKSRSRCICDVEVGARSIACAHLCNLVYWHRRPLDWDPAAWEFPGDAQANSWRDYERRAGYGIG